MYKDDPCYYSVSVPFEEFFESWDENVVDYECASVNSDDDTEDWRDKGYIFWYRYQSTTDIEVQ